MANKRAGILINPISGGKSKAPVIELIKTNFPKEYEFEFIMWEKAEQREDIIKKIQARNYDVVVAAGGDGTINLVATSVKGTNSAMAIIPLGSGNGLARHLHIPLDTQKAVELIGTGKSLLIDACNVNGINFFCTSGVGFDAEIGKAFAESKKRGFASYIQLIIKKLLSYKTQQYSLIIDGKQVDVSAFLITLANASQYGNDAYIAAHANCSDGLIDVVVLKPFNFFTTFIIAQKILNKTLHLSRFVDVYKGKEIKVIRKNEGAVHFDGEPEEMGTELNYTIQPSVVKVIV